MIISLPAGTDLAPALKGLPNDLCPCPHWGYILTGRIRVTYAYSVEILKAGDLFYLPPGHTPLGEEDVEFIEFSRPSSTSLIGTPPPRDTDHLPYIQRRLGTEARSRRRDEPP